MKQAQEVVTDAPEEILQANRRRKVTASPGKAPWLRPLLFLALVIVIVVVGRSLELGRLVDDLQSWIRSFGSAGPLVFILVYMAAVVAAIPGVALTVLAGALFGSFLGVVVVSAGSTLGAALAFLIARYLMRETVARWLGNNPVFRRLDQLTEVHGAGIVALTRLVPVFPFNLLNYGFGLTRVPFRTYLIWSWLCMLPATVLYVVGTDTVVRAVAEGSVPWTLAGVLAAAGVLVALLVRYARKRLREKERGEGR
jgi:uncharacterized membrane protein YdjX (TVP38/TMEM64 family)